MALTEINGDPTDKDLRVFGLLLPAFAAVFGHLVQRRTGLTMAGWTVWATGAVLSLVYFVVPRVRRLVFVGWSYVTFPLGWFLSHAVMAAVYFLVVTPIALLVRLVGHDPLQRRWDPSAPSYWVRRGPEGDVRRYFRQF